MRDEYKFPQERNTTLASSAQPCEQAAAIRIPGARACAAAGCRTLETRAQQVELHLSLATLFAVARSCWPIRPPMRGRSSRPTTVAAAMSRSFREKRSNHNSCRWSHDHIQAPSSRGFFLATSSQQPYFAAPSATLCGSARRRRCALFQLAEAQMLDRCPRAHLAFGRLPRFDCGQ